MEPALQQAHDSQQHMPCLPTPRNIELSGLTPGGLASRITSIFSGNTRCRPVSLTFTVFKGEWIQGELLLALASADRLSKDAGHRKWGDRQKRLRFYSLPIDQVMVFGGMLIPAQLRLHSGSSVVPISCKMLMICNKLSGKQCQYETRAF